MPMKGVSIALGSLTSIWSNGCSPWPPSSSLSSSSSLSDPLPLEPDSSSSESPRISALMDLYLSSFSRKLGSALKMSEKVRMKEGRRQRSTLGPQRSVLSVMCTHSGPPVPAARRLAGPCV